MITNKKNRNKLEVEKGVKEKKIEIEINNNRRRKKLPVQCSGELSELKKT